MKRFLSTLLALFLLSATPPAHSAQFGQTTAMVCLEDSVPVSTGSFANFFGTDFDIGANCSIVLSSLISHAGSCIGEADDFCGNVFFTSKVVDGTDAFWDRLGVGVSSFAAGVEFDMDGDARIDGTLGIGKTADSGIELDVSGDAAISSLKVGATGTAASGIEFDLTGEAKIATIFGGTAAGDSIILDATNAATNLTNSAAVISIRNPVTLWPTSLTSELLTVGAYKVGVIGQTYTMDCPGGGCSPGGTTPNIQLFQFSGTWSWADNPATTQFYGFLIDATFTNAAGATAMGFTRFVEFLPTLQSSGGTVSWGAPAGIIFKPNFSGSGTAANITTRVAGINMVALSVFESEWSVGDYMLGYVGANASLIDGVISRFGAIEFEDQTDASIASVYSLWVKDPDAILGHEGPALFGADQGQTNPVRPATGTMLQIDNGYLQATKAGTTTTSGDCDAANEEYRSFVQDTASGVDQVCTCIDNTWKCRAADGQPIVDSDDFTADCTWSTQDDTFLCADATVTLTGGKTATIFATVRDEDGGATRETTTWRLYKQAGSCGTISNNNNPSGTEITTAGNLTSPEPTSGKAVQATLIFYDTSTLAGTSHYCLTAENDTNGNAHTMDFAHTVVIEYQ